MFSPHFRQRFGGGLKLVGDWDMSLQYAIHCNHQTERSERPEKRYSKNFQMDFSISKPFSTVMCGRTVEGFGKI